MSDIVATNAYYEAVKDISECFKNTQYSEEFIFEVEKLTRGLSIQNATEIHNRFKEAKSNYHAEQRRKFNKPFILTFIISLIIALISSVVGWMIHFIPSSLVSSLTVSLIDEIICWFIGLLCLIGFCSLMMTSYY